MSKYNKARDDLLTLENKLEEQIEFHLKSENIDYFEMVSIYIREGCIQFEIRSEYLKKTVIKIDLDSAKLEIVGSNRPVKVEKIVKAIEITSKYIWEEL